MKMRAISASVLLVLTGCSAVGAGPAVDKAGVPIGPITLRAWSSEAAYRPSGMQLTNFAEAVQRLSGGAMNIDTTYETDQSSAGPDSHGDHRGSGR